MDEILNAYELLFQEQQRRNINKRITEDSKVNLIFKDKVISTDKFELVLNWLFGKGIIPMFPKECYEEIRSKHDRVIWVKDYNAIYEMLPDLITNEDFRVELI